MLGENEIPLRSTRSLAMGVVVLLVGQIVLIAIQALTINRVGLLNRLQAGGLVTRAQAEAADDAVAGAVGHELLVFLATVVVWCIWQHRSQGNADVASVDGVEFTPAWAFGWWFIPFANLVKPFQAIRELWKASHGGNGWRSLPTWPAIGWWWRFWIAGNVTFWAAGGKVRFGIGVGNLGQATTVPQLIVHDSWTIVWLVARVIAAVLAIVIVRSIAPFQQAAAAAWIPPAPVAPGPTILPGPPPPRV